MDRGDVEPAADAVAAGVPAVSGAGMRRYPLPPPRRWHPHGTQRTYGRPAVGDLVASGHAVWRVAGVDDEPLLDDEDREYWVLVGMPDLETWPQRPYRVRVEFVAGVRPEGKPPKSGQYVSRRSPRHACGWEVYPSGRWPQCSCCGEPMPCRAELEDQHVAYAEERVSEFEARMPGCCWSCNEPITQRQRAVVYPGINLDLPTGPEPRFHLRQSCRRTAERYERRWIAADPAREPVLTYPECPGTLIVHADGTSECFGGADDCWGHDTHDHGRLVACYAQSHGCGRQCPSEGHSGTRTRARPLRESDQLQ